MIPGRGQIPSTSNPSKASLNSARASSDSAPLLAEWCAAATGADATNAAALIAAAHVRRAWLKARSRSLLPIGFDDALPATHGDANTSSTSHRSSGFTASK